MASGEAFEGLAWVEVEDAPPGTGSGACGDIDRPVPAGLGRPHPERARQFAPFAALRGYYDLVQEKERVVEPRRPLAEDEARELAEAVAQLQRGQLVSVTFYENDAYRTIVGTVSQIDMIYHDLWIVRTRIPFDELCALEALS
ncbi:hypothetical protein VJ918_00500 [Adlercreutzia sp. R21]|uniref:YolD-like family protein n=1 Tax=Adlercreutzia wanghongyangiae TaxID=3111451 RepID=A0ABU6IKB8_9ACTN|nr:hypothetical protein [Adlercreutzia sp. R21]MEC4176910.1 hypothetical protein [Adlercreutzia sp. R7]MEC4183284.1 hypothetical protein [Adlercreutzia sp. R21]